MKNTDVIIIGAGPVGLFAVHQLGIKGLKAIVIDNLNKIFEVDHLSAYSLIKHLHSFCVLQFLRFCFWEFK